MVIVEKKDKQGRGMSTCSYGLLGDLNVSYSGLKSAFKRLVARMVMKEDEGEVGAKIPSSDELGRLLTEEEKLPLSLAFETAALEAITRKVALGVEEYKVKEIWLGGGVAASPVLEA
jgi:tRNA A37 threonylcarbamoyltransferase TsaD